MDKIIFTVNGEKCSLTGTEVFVDTSLNEYIRDYLQLHGTKAMCHEGGCGACIVSVCTTHPTTKEKHVFAVNSCLVSVLSCHEWDIHTVEGIGNRKDGYNQLQTMLATFNGTQCGYCTPGWVMNMHSLLENNSKLTMKEVENSFGGNMCRCTGYRPILDAFKTFATELEPNLQNKLQDLEDLHLMKCKKKCERKCSLTGNDWCVIDNKNESLIELKTTATGGKWYKAYTIGDVFKVISREGADSYRLIAGNTGKGIYPIIIEAKAIIDISSVESLNKIISDVNLVLGAGVSLSDVMKTFKTWSKKDTNFSYLETFYDHLDLVAHIPVRNIGTIGGNLAIKCLNHEFPSDIFLLLETVGATVTIVKHDLQKAELSMQDFLKIDIKDKLITEVKLPPLTHNNVLRTYKIMPRAQNAHAIVNAGFLFNLDDNNTIKCATIVFGNISPKFSRALQTEKLLIGKKFNNMMLQSALKKLQEEVIPLDMPPEPSVECRKMIALGLFYKAILSLANDVNPRYKSGGSILKREVSKGTQIYETDKTLWPLNKPVPKLEGLIQCSGEATYSCDVNFGPKDVHVAFVLSEVCRADLLGFDASNALKIPGVIAFFSAKDIPGKNSFTPLDVPWMQFDEEIFASSTISYYGQPIGVVAAKSRRLALAASKLVKVKYKKINAKPVLSIRDALVAADKDKRLRQDINIAPKKKGTDIKHKFSGSFAVPSQYHYTMETQSCNVVIKDDTVIVRSSTQWMDIVNVAVARALGIEQNNVFVEVPRVGGAYGSKASRSSQIACACAIVSKKLNRPATLVMPITDNMAAIGKRQHCEFDYECGVNQDGIIQYLNVSYYSDNGCSYSDSAAPSIASAITNLYVSDSFSIAGYSVLTDKSSETWCRAPATTEGIAFAEHIMERISHITGKDHVDVRLANIQPKHDAIKEMIMYFQNDTKFEERRAAITKFNQENAWKKKGLRLSLMSFPVEYFLNFPVTISVYHTDGTIAISHGGIEMGQGINTKIAQVCASTLKVPLEKLVIRPSDSFVSANAMASNGSVTSDSIAFATVKACNDLLKRLEPSRNQLIDPTWEEVVKKAYNNGVNLQASYMMSENDGLQGYNVYGICAAEVELDLLTGNHIIRRMDVLEDTGISMSPEIDIGQIEGSLIMGIGLWTSEELIYDKNTGRLLTDRTWTYKPPGAKDIPEDFRVTFRPNSSNPAGVLRSKVTGEPALVLAVVLTHALHDAILDGRKEFGYNDVDWVHVGSPYSVQNIMASISHKIDKFLLM